MKEKLRSELRNIMKAEEFEKLSGNFILINCGGNAPFKSRNRGTCVGFRFKKSAIIVEIYITKHLARKNQNLNEKLENQWKDERKKHSFSSIKQYEGERHIFRDTTFTCPIKAAQFAYDFALFLK